MDNEPPQSEPKRDASEPVCLYMSSVLLAATGILVLSFGGVMFWRADGAPPVEGIREGVRHHYGIVFFVGVAMAVIGAVIGALLKATRR
jgi:hypothetical protein